MDLSQVSLLAIGFISIAIMLGLGIQILGNTQNALSCNNLPGSGINPNFNTVINTIPVGLFYANKIIHPNNQHFN